LSDRVELPGRLDRPGVAHTLAGASLFVLPSRHEPFGIVNVEAMAAGVPIVATAVGGIPDLVRDGVEGLLVPADDPVALAAAMESVLDDPWLARALTVRGLARAPEYDWRSITARYLEVYSRVSRVVAAR
jgi:glycosyltransferase involved in cell wall biosynthesis